MGIVVYLVLLLRRTVRSVLMLIHALHAQKDSYSHLITNARYVGNHQPPTMLQTPAYLAPQSMRIVSHVLMKAPVLLVRMVLRYVMGNAFHVQKGYFGMGANVVLAQHSAKYALLILPAPNALLGSLLRMEYVLGA